MNCVKFELSMMLMFTSPGEYKAVKAMADFRKTARKLTIKNDFKFVDDVIVNLFAEALIVIRIVDWQ